MNTNTNSDTNTGHGKSNAEAADRELIDRVIRDAGAIGKVWARYGLEVGRAALQTSATTLQRTAGLLGDIASRFQEEQREEKDATTVTTTGEPVQDDKPADPS